MRRFTLLLLSAAFAVNGMAQTVTQTGINYLPDDGLKTGTAATAPNLMRSSIPLKAFTPVTTTPVMEQPEGDVYECVYSNTFYYVYSGYALDGSMDCRACRIVFQGDTAFYIPDVIRDVDSIGWFRLDRASKGSKNVYVGHTPQAIYTAWGSKNVYYATRLTGSTSDITGYKTVYDSNGELDGDIRFQFNNNVLKQVTTDGTEIIGFTNDEGEYTGYGSYGWNIRLIEDEPVKVPAGLTKELYQESYYNGSETVDMPVYVARDGNDVYLFNASDTTIAAKGTINGDKCVFKAGQYAGHSDGYGRQFYFYPFKWRYTNYNWTFTPLTDSLVMNYDAETETFSCPKGYGFYFHVGNSSDSEYYTNACPNGKFAKYFEKAATPNVPEIYNPEEQFENYQEHTNGYSYGQVTLVLDYHDTEGNFIDPNKMTWCMYIDDPEYPFVFDSIDYYLGDDVAEMEEIPYYFQAPGGIVAYSTITRGIYFFTEVVDSIGFEQIFYGGGERRSSGIVWYNVHTGTINGITPTSATNMADKRQNAYYDLSGRRLSAPQRGVTIVRRADGTVRKVAK